MRLDSMRTRTVLIAAALFFLSLPTAFTQDFSKLEVEPVASDFPGGEGPVWSRQGFLIFSDYSRDRLYKLVPGKPPAVYREDSRRGRSSSHDAICTRRSTGVPAGPSCCRWCLLHR